MNADDFVAAGEVNRAWSFYDITRVGRRTWTPTQQPRTVTATTSTNPLDDELRGDCSSNPIVATLHTAVGYDGLRHTYKKIDATTNTLTIAFAAGETGDGVSTLVLSQQYAMAKVLSNGTTWDLETPQFGSFTSTAISGLTATRVPYVSTAGLLVDSANLTFNGTIVSTVGVTANSISTTQIAATLTNHGVLVGQSTSPILATAAGSAGQILRSGGASADPLWSTPTFPNAAAQGDIIYASSTSIFTTLAKSATSTRYLSNTGTSSSPAWAQVDLSNGVTSTLPIGNGGTGNASSAWSTYTPTISSTVGTITTPGTCAGRFFQQGKIVWWQASLAISTNGTGATLVTVTLPSGPGNVVSAARYYGTGLGVLVSGKQLLIKFQNGTQMGFIQNYDGTYPGATGELLEVSGFYEAA